MSSPFIVFGNHTVRSIINSPFFELKKVILLKDNFAKDKELLNLLDSKKIAYYLLDKSNFSRYSFDKKNQGIVAYIRKYHYFSLKSLLALAPKNKLPLLVMLDSIEDPHNFGAILRTLAALDVDGIIIPKKNQVPVNATVAKVSVGGIAHVPVCQVDSLAETFNELKKKGYSLVSTVCDPEAESYTRVKFSSPTCLLFGNEHQGIKKSLIKKSDKLIYIPMKNEVNSLNVSVSCAVICSQIINQ